jgi:hypothetical protein
MPSASRVAGPRISRSARPTALHDEDAAATGYIRVIAESGEDHLYPAQHFVAVELPKRRSGYGQRHGASATGTVRRTSRFSEPGLALLAPAAERGVMPQGGNDGIPASQVRYRF